VVVRTFWWKKKRGAQRGSGKLGTEGGEIKPPNFSGKEQRKAEKKTQAPPVANAKKNGENPAGAGGLGSRGADRGKSSSHNKEVLGGYGKKKGWDKSPRGGGGLDNGAQKKKTQKIV